MAMNPNVQNEALAMRRYSSMPAPMIRVDLVWNIDIDESHSAAKRTENNVMIGPG